MVHYSASVGSYAFLFHDVFGVERLTALPGSADFTRETTEAVLGEAAKLAIDHFLPLNGTGDREGCRKVKGGVATPAGFKQAYDAFAEGGMHHLRTDAYFSHGRFLRSSGQIVSPTPALFHVTFVEKTPR